MDPRNMFPGRGGGGNEPHACARAGEGGVLLYLRIPGVKLRQY